MRVKPYLYSAYIARNSSLPSGEVTGISPDSPVDFLSFILGVSPANHHLTWIDAIVSGSNSVLRKVAGGNLRISAPRGSAKTTIISTLLAWVIAHNPHIRIILCSYSEEIALNISVAVKNIITTDKFYNLFPTIRKSRRWRDRSWVIDRDYAGVQNPIKDPTLLAVGANGSIASRRADLIIIDDPIRSGKDIANPAIRADMVRWWSEVLHPTLVPHGRAIVLCTRYRIDDIHGTIFCEKNGWQVITQKAIILDDTGNECSFWPEYMPLDFLRAKREENPVAFASQYQNVPLSEENQLISPSWILRGHLPSDFSTISIGVDLASSEKTTADYSALVVMGISSDTYYVLSCFRGRWSLSETIAQLLRLYHLYSPQCDRLNFQIESIAYQVAFIREFKRVVIEQGLRCRVDEVRLKGDKLSRLYGISGLFESKKVVFNESAPMTILIEELLNFGVSAHDDLVDALVYCLHKLYKVNRKLEGGAY